MLGADAMMCSEQPSVEVAEDDVDHGQVLVRLGVVAAYGDGVMSEAEPTEPLVADPPVRSHQRPPQHVCRDEGLQRFLLSVRDLLEPQPTRYEAATVATPMAGLPGRRVRIGAGCGLVRANFDGADHKHLVRHTSPLPLRRTAHERLVHLRRPLSPDGVALRANHRRPKLVEHLERRLVAVDPEQLLELDRAHPGRVRRHQPRGPEPKAGRLLRPVHDGVGREARLVLPVPAPEDMRTGPDAVGLAGVAADRADEAVGEAAGEQVREACRVVGEGPLKVRDGTWASHPERLHEPALWGNRIGKVLSCQKSYTRRPVIGLSMWKI